MVRATWSASPPLQPHGTSQHLADCPRAMAPYFSRTATRTSADSSRVFWAGFERVSLIGFSLWSQLLDQRFELQDGNRIDAVTDAGRIDRAADQARLFQDLEVLGHRGLRERQPPDDVAAHALPLGEHPHDRHARRVAERLGEPRQLRVARRRLLAVDRRTGRAARCRAHRASSWVLALPPTASSSIVNIR